MLINNFADSFFKQIFTDPEVQIHNCKPRQISFLHPVLTRYGATVCCTRCSRNDGTYNRERDYSSCKNKSKRGINFFIQHYILDKIESAHWSNTRALNYWLVLHLSMDWYRYSNSHLYTSAILLVKLKRVQ